MLLGMRCLCTLLNAHSAAPMGICSSAHAPNHVSGLHTPWRRVRAENVPMLLDIRCNRLGVARSLVLPHRCTSSLGALLCVLFRARASSVFVSVDCSTF